MARKEKSTNLYRTPFCAGYWRDALAELKDTKMLVFAAMIVVMRVALKTIIRIPLGPSLDITPAFMANALGAMVYGPVVGGLGAIISDVLGVLLRGDTYFLPYVLTEISGSVIFAMFFYRQKITPTRVILSRFCICLFVNILMQTPIDILFQKVMYGKSTYVLTLPRIFKNLYMFPIEAVVLTVFLRVMQPITTRMRLTYVKSEGLRFEKKQVVLLLILVLLGTASLFGYLFIHYDTTSITTGYTTQEVIDNNKKMQPIILEETDAIGGISRTVNYNGNRMDIGGHRFFSKDKNVTAFWENMMPTQGAPSIDDKILGRDASRQRALRGAGARRFYQVRHRGLRARGDSRTATHYRTSPSHGAD